MRHLLTSVAFLILLTFQLSAQSPGREKLSENSQSQPSDDTITPAGSALSTIFSPSRAPKQKTMGLLQRSFLDLADQGDQKLEVAIVVDGTQSMATELAGVRRSIHQMLSDLRLYRNNEVRAAIVVYRDAGSPSGEVVIPLKQFTDDQESITKAVASLQPESGAPFFHELPDLGLHQALTALPWTDDDQVTKWIMLFGDAPPYAETFKDAKTPQAYRRYATPVLVSIAKKKNIRINCVLCTSSQNVSEPYDKSIDQTRNFMNALCSGTDGLMLDLSYPEIRTALIDAGKQPDVDLVHIEPISAIDLAAVRRENLQRTSDIKQVSLAVIPHMPISKISFDARNPAVQVSTALRTKLAKIPGVRVASPRDIKEQLRRLRAEGLNNEKAIRGLAARLGVDFVVWGSLQPDGATVQTAAYRRDNGQQIVPIKLAKNSDDMAYVLIQASAKSAPDDPAISQMLSQMQKLESVMVAPMANGVATSNELLTAIEALDQALAYDAGSEESIELLSTADQASKNAATAEPRNALAHWLQANVAYNQASRLYRIGDTKAATARMREMKNSLGRAVEFRDTVKTPSLVTEIEADYYLLIDRKITEAVDRYLAMIRPDQPLQSQLRGHWMLAGIYAGDWGNAEQPIVDADKARRHITEILANWPDSPEAKLLKKWLRWDDRQEQTDFNYLPRLNTELSGV
jgi:hypothetical protein